MAALRPLRTLLGTAPARRAAAAAPVPRRGLAATARARHPYKDDQDRESVRPKTTEETQSGTADEVAHEKGAFDRSQTAPEQSRRASQSALDVSGADQSASKPQGERDKEKEWGRGPTGKKKSAGGSPEKKGKPPV